VLADAPNGRWRDVLTGTERTFDHNILLTRAVGEHGFAVYERI
jgi:hypothetical protein